MIDLPESSRVDLGSPSRSEDGGESCSGEVELFGYTYLGDYAAVESSVAALGHHDDAPVTGTWPVSWALSRSYLALARLSHAGSSGGPHAAAQALAPVLTLPKVQRINQLDRVFIDIGRRLRQPAYRTDPAAALGDAIRDFRQPMTPEITAS